MPFLLGNKKLIPAPILTFQQQVNFANDGTPISNSYNVNLKGTLLPNRGSPTSNGWAVGAGDPPNESFSSDADKFNSILAKQELLRQSLAATGYKLSYSSPGNPSVEFYPRLQTLNFTEGNWVIKCDYEASLVAPYFNLNQSLDDNELPYGTGYANLALTSITDDYQVHERDDGTHILDISRTVSATANFGYQNPSGTAPWINARTWVRNRLSSVPFSSGLVTIASGVFASSSGYNFVQEENINALAGSYSVSQKFTYHNRNFIETRDISHTLDPEKTGNGGPDVERITVNGSITGMDPNNDPSGKFLVAQTYWQGISDGLGTIYGAFGRAVTTNYTENRSFGTINYSINFINNTGSYYKHNYDVSYTVGPNNPSVGINGRIEGVTPDDFFYGSGTQYTKFDMALTGWTAINPTIKTLAFAYASLVGSGSLYLDLAPIRTVSYDKPNGVITYNYNFAYNPSGTSLTYVHEYNIEYTTENALPHLAGLIRTGLPISATINGAITGLQSGDNPGSKLTNAKTGWATIDDSLYTILNDHYSVIGNNASNLPLNSGCLRRVVGLNMQAGVVTYSANFNNFQAPGDATVALQDVTVEDQNAKDIFAIQLIPGRTAGPILQNISTRNEHRKTVNIALTMYPKTSAPYYWATTDQSTVAAIASGLFASIVSPIGTRYTNWFMDGDSENWNPKAGFYTRNISIVYTQ